jgi:hypothetical protein
MSHPGIATVRLMDGHAHALMYAANLRTHPCRFPSGKPAVGDIARFVVSAAPQTEPLVDRRRLVGTAPRIVPMRAPASASAAGKEWL